MSEGRRKLVEKGYDSVAERYPVGFEVLYAKPRTGGTGKAEETWLWVLARRGSS